MRKPKLAIVNLPLSTPHIYLTLTDTVIPSADLAEWLLEWGDLWNGYRARVIVKNYRAKGVVGGWKSKRKHIEFAFSDKEIALLFKLTWGGV